MLLRGKHACVTALTVAGHLFPYGYPISIKAVNNDDELPQHANFLVDVPPFGWNHSLKYWSESHRGRAHRYREHPRKDLFGAETQDHLSNEPRFRNILRLGEVPWMKYHKVRGSILYPGAGMMIAGIEAMSQRAGSSRPISGYELRDVMIAKPSSFPTTMVASRQCSP